MENVAEAVVSDVCPVTPRVPARPRVYPGVDEPIPTLPFASTVKSDVPDDDATLKSAVVGDDEVPCTARVADGEVS